MKETNINKSKMKEELAKVENKKIEKKKSFQKRVRVINKKPPNSKEQAIKELYKLYKPNENDSKIVIRQ